MSHQPPFQHFEKDCKVCGDRANYVNYGALTCDSCKTFFRRHVLQPKALMCLNGNCEINFFSRKNCAKCRLSKCISVGMRGGAVGTEDCKRRKEVFELAVELLGQSKEDAKLQEFINNYKFQKDSEAENEWERRRRKRRDLSFPPASHLDGVSIGAGSSKSSSQGTSGHTSRDDLDGVNGFTRKSSVNYGLNGFTSKPSVMYGSNLEAFTAEEKAKFEELEVFATTLFKIPDNILANNHHDIKSDRTIVSALLWQNVVVSLITRGIRNLDVFNSFSENDKKVIMKNSIPGMMLLYSAKFYSSIADAWVFQSSLDYDKMRTIVPFSVAECCSYSIDFVGPFKSFLNSFQTSWRYDDLLFAILLVITLLNPDEPGLEQATKVNFERISYTYVLKRYLESKCLPYEENYKAFDCLINALEKLNHLRKCYASASPCISDSEFQIIDEHLKNLKF